MRKRFIVSMLTAATLPLSVSAQSDAVEYEYDALGRLASATYTEDGSYIVYSYDENGNRTEVLIQRPGEAAIEPEIEGDDPKSARRFIITPRADGSYNILALGG